MHNQKEKLFNLLVIYYSVMRQKLHQIVDILSKPVDISVDKMFTNSKLSPELV